MPDGGVSAKTAGRPSNGGGFDVDYQAVLDHDHLHFSSSSQSSLFVRDTPFLHIDLAIMSPHLEEPTQADLDAPSKVAPQLVAPEPGMAAKVLS
jgi:hypothetical protein